MYVHEHMKLNISTVVEGLVLSFRNQDSYKNFLGHRGRMPKIVGYLQDLVDLDSLSDIKPFVFQALLQLSRPSGLHPRCMALSGLQKIGQQAVAGGAFGDIWKGLVQEQSVCVKIMRIFEDSNVEEVLKEFGREAIIWRQLWHPNVLPFFGVYYLDSRLCLVSPWMENGHIMKFLAAKKPNNAERLPLILDVALGLQYLHEQKVVHGDLKGANILVTPSQRACIADFGLSTIAEAMTVRFTHTTATARGGTPRYQAPELIELGSAVRNHYGSDVYAFACVCYEIVADKPPFHEIRSDMAVAMGVLKGDRPPRPEWWAGHEGTRWPVGVNVKLLGNERQDATNDF
ncbi:kinase-like domain-containing protein [Mycena olivaceomarginata]|nr:kinase-like domain-containing protein [Mycena olivaceomarginata]